MSAQDSSSPSPELAALIGRLGSVIGALAATDPDHVDLRALTQAVSVLERLLVPSAPVDTSRLRTILEAPATDLYTTPLSTGDPVTQVLDIRIINTLLRHRISNIGALLCLSEGELLDIRDFGAKSVSRVVEFLASLELEPGYKLLPDDKSLVVLPDGMSWVQLELVRPRLTKPDYTVILTVQVPSGFEHFFPDQRSEHENSFWRVAAAPTP